VEAGSQLTAAVTALGDTAVLLALDPGHQLPRSPHDHPGIPANPARPPAAAWVRTPTRRSDWHRCQQQHQDTAAAAEAPGNTGHACLALRSLLDFPAVSFLGSVRVPAPCHHRDLSWRRARGRRSQPRLPIRQHLGFWAMEQARNRHPDLCLFLCLLARREDLKANWVLLWRSGPCPLLDLDLPSRLACPARTPRGVAVLSREHGMGPRDIARSCRHT